MKKIILSLTACVALIVTGCIDMKDDSLRTNPNDPLSTTSFIDNFTRADGPAGNNWAGDTGVFVIGANKLALIPNGGGLKVMHHLVPSQAYKYLKFQVGLTNTPAPNNVMVKLGTAANPDMLTFKYDQGYILNAGFGPNPGTYIHTGFVGAVLTVEVVNIDVKAGSATVKVDGITKANIAFTAGTLFDKITLVNENFGSGTYVIDSISILPNMP
ncbi:MAG: hypothetical protein AABZ39_17985 [Spirochaetota bacterium]